MSDSAANKEKLLRETVAMLRAVLISASRGVRFEKLFHDYKELTFKTIPYKELGFPRLEVFLQSIPDVARVEKGPDGEWVVKGVASDADKHVAKLISKQNKPRVRKSAKSMFSKRKITPIPPEVLPKSTPVRKSVVRPSAPRQWGTKYTLPPRMQKLQETKNQNRPEASAQPGKVKESTAVKNRHISVGRGKLFKKATQGIKTSKNSETQHGLSASSSFKAKDIPSLSVSISNTSEERNVMAAVSPKQSAPSSVLDDIACVKWMKAEISKVPCGLWGTRLEHLYKEKFKKALPKCVITEELKFRPDIVVLDEPSPGKFLLYPPRKQQMSTTKTGDKFVLPCHLPDVGSSILVYISHTENLSCFYVSRKDSVSEKLSEEIQKQYKATRYSSDAISSISPGQIFCAQFTQDNSFYRACVLEVVDSKHIKVLYVDFGNKEVIAVEKLRVLIGEFKTQPIQAYECCLDGVQPADQSQEWSDDTIKKFDDLTSGKELRMTVHEVDDKVLTVSLIDVSSQLDIAEEMKKAGLAISTKNLDSTPSSSSSSLSSSSGVAFESKSPPKTENVASRTRRIKLKSPGIVELPDEPYIDVFVCNIMSTHNVHLRLVGDEYSGKLEAIQESMTSYYSDSKDQVTTDPAVGDLFAVLSDEVWCRVKVTGTSEGKIRVFFVDHGDATETSKAELRPLATQFRQLPFQAFECALNGLPKTKNPDVVGKFKKLIMGEVAVAEVVKKTNDIVFIELLDTRTDANISVNAVMRKFVIPDEELKPVLPKVGKTTDVDIVYISPTGSVFLHVSAAGSRRLEELNRDLSEYYASKRSKANEFIAKPIPGNLCCAKCEDDGNWYRSKIISFTDKTAVEVLYVDYGNTEILPSTNLREPTQENAHVLSLPFQALECQLYDVPKDGWSDDLIDRIFEIVEQGTLQAEVLSDGELPSVSLLVTVETEGEHVTHRLASLLGLAANFEDHEDDIDIVSETSQANVESESSDDLTNNVNESGDNLAKAESESGDGVVNIGDEAGNNLVKVMDEAGDSLAKVDNESADTLVNGDRHMTNRESGNVVQESSKHSQKDEERAIPKQETSIGNAKDEKPRNIDEAAANERGQSSEGRQEEPNKDGTIAGSTSEQAVQANQVKANWKALPLKTGWIDVHVTDVKDPDHFTFRLLENGPEISKLLDEMYNFYQNQVVENEVTLVEGGVYAVLHDDENWYRGIVESLINGEKAYVRLLDYGGYVTLDKEDIRDLDEKFLQLPFQGVQAKLAGVKCTKKKWPKHCIKYFKFLTEQYLVARVTSGHTEYNANLPLGVTVELCDTSDPIKDVFIADKFIENHTEVERA